MSNSIYQLLKQIKSAAAGGGSFMPPQPLPNSIKAKQIEQQEQEAKMQDQAGQADPQLAQMQKAQEDAVNQAQQAQQQLAQLQGELQNVQAQAQQQQQALQMQADQEIQKARMDAQYELQAEKIKNQQKLLSMQEKYMRASGKAKPDQNSILATQLKRLQRKVNGAKSASVASKLVPVIGPLLSAGSVASNLRKGNYASALTDAAGAIAGMFPGPGTALSLGLVPVSAALENAPGYTRIPLPQSPSPGITNPSNVNRLLNFQKSLPAPWHAPMLASKKATDKVPLPVKEDEVLWPLKKLPKAEPTGNAPSFGSVKNSTLKKAVGPTAEKYPVQAPLAQPPPPSAAPNAPPPNAAQTAPTAPNAANADLQAQYPAINPVKLQKYFSSTPVGSAQQKSKESLKPSTDKAQGSGLTNLLPLLSPLITSGIYAFGSRMSNKGKTPFSNMSAPERAGEMNRNLLQEYGFYKGAYEKPGIRNYNVDAGDDIRKAMPNLPSVGSHIPSPITLLQSGSQRHAYGPSINLQSEQTGYGPPGSIGHLVRQLIFQIAFPSVGLKNPMMPDFENIYKNFNDPQAYKINQ